MAPLAADMAKRGDVAGNVVGVQSPAISVTAFRTGRSESTDVPSNPGWSAREKLEHAATLGVYDHLKQPGAAVFQMINATTANADGTVSRRLPVFTVSKELHDSVSVLGQVTGKPRIHNQFGAFLYRLWERNRAIASRRDMVPDSDREYVGSPTHIGFGKEVDGLVNIGSPHLSALLSPSGGKIGAGNDELIPWRVAPLPIIRHAQQHDAGGYALIYHDVGEGYQYGPIHDFLPATNPLGGQLNLIVQAVRYVVPAAPAAG